LEFEKLVIFFLVLMLS